MLMLVTCLGAVDSVTRITSCTSLSNDQCLQNLTSCPQPPCKFSCDRSQFSCIQVCRPIPSSNLTKGNLCDALDCQASQNCHQICLQLDCNSTSCSSKECRQICQFADCGSMWCQQGVNKCNQLAHTPTNGQVMKCDAKSCNQHCRQRSSKNYSCGMTCSETVETCEQSGLVGNFQQKCSAGVKNCTQKTNLYAIGNMECEADRCAQACTHSTCNMSCSSRALECTQTGGAGVFGFDVVNMYCAADVCKQHCDTSKCNMTCSSTVKECSQTCKRGKCLVRCDAQVCYRVKGMSTSTPTWFYPTDSVSHISGALLTLWLVLMLLVIGYW